MQHFLWILFLSYFTFGALAQPTADSSYKLLWEIEHPEKDQTSYLFGTFHSNDPEVFNFPDSVYWALHQSDAVALEVDMTELMGELDVITDTKSVRRRSGLGWLLPRTKSASDPTTSTSYGSDEGRPQFLDLTFKDYADACGKGFHALETVAEQMNIGSSLIPSEKPTLNRSTWKPEDLKRFYLAGDIEKLYEITLNSTVNYEGLFEELITDRNIIMAGRLDSLMQHQQIFCAVGAAHLSGEKGMLRLLEKEGYRVRAVLPSFTETGENYKNKLNTCGKYEFQDLQYGYKIPFGGKPKVAVDEFGGKSVDYQELGQGNSYAIYTLHYETIDDLWPIVRSYFEENGREIEQLDSFKIGKNSRAMQAKIIEPNNSKYWLRVFANNDILYVLYCSGGHRFLNSNRPQSFFDAFVFSEQEQNSTLKEEVISPSHSMRVLLPENYIESYGDQETSKYWRAKWFNPQNAENFYVYESTLKGNQLFFTNEHFGNHLLGEFKEDSVRFYDYKETDTYVEKYFEAKKDGRVAHGKISMMGNLIHFIQYTGENKAHKDAFLNSFVHVPFRDSLKVKTVQKLDFSWDVTNAGFKRMQDDSKLDYRTLKHWVLNDDENTILYDVQIKIAKPWAYSQRGTRDLLENQIIWPGDDIPAIIDTTFYLADSIPKMKYRIQYTSSKNCISGTVQISGKSIINYSVAYPNAAKSTYDKYELLSTFKFHDLEKKSFEKVDTLAIQEALNDGARSRAALVAFWNLPHTNSETAWSFLKRLKTLDHDNELVAVHESPRAALMNILEEKELLNLEVFEYWKKHAPSADPEFTQYYIEALSKLEKGATYFKKALKISKELSITLPDYIVLFEPVAKYPERYYEVWEIIVPHALSQPNSYELFDLLDGVSTDPFFESFIQGDNFKEYCLRGEQPDWVAFKYFHLLHKTSISKQVFLETLDQWDLAKKPERKGIELAWLEINGKRLKRKQKKLIDNYILVATGYAKVMAEANHLSLKQLSYESIFGVLAYDYFQEGSWEENRCVKHLFNVSSLANEQQEIAVYASRENGKVQYFVKVLPLDKRLPSYYEHGTEIYFIPEQGKLEKEELKEAVRKLKI